MGRGGGNESDDGKRLLYGRPVPIPKKKRGQLSQEAAQEIDSFVSMLYRNTDNPNVSRDEASVAAGDLMSDFHHWVDASCPVEWNDLLRGASQKSNLDSGAAGRQFAESARQINKSDIEAERKRVLGPDAFEDSIAARASRIGRDLSHTGLRPDRILILIRTWSEAKGIEWGEVVAKSDYHYENEVADED